MLACSYEKEAIADAIRLQIVTHEHIEALLEQVGDVGGEEVSFECADEGLQRRLLEVVDGHVRRLLQPLLNMHKEGRYVGVLHIS